MKNNIKSSKENFLYLFRELYLFRSSAIFLPFWGIASRIFLSLTAIWMPKVILDLIESRAEAGDLFLWIMATGAALLLASSLNATAHNSIDGCSQVFLLTRLKAHWEEKMMDLDYEVFASHLGKISAEKARYAISSPVSGVVTYLRKATDLLECLGGFLALGTVLFLLHPLILVLLFAMFGAELWYGVHAEAHKHLLQGERARANRKLNYIAYHTRGIREGKDIRLYSMVPWLRGIGGAALRDKDRVEERAAHYDLGKMLFGAALVFLRNGCAYAYLVYQYFHGDMTIGDFTLYFSAITGLGTFLSELSSGYSDFMEADHSVTDFREFMELDQDGKKKENRMDAPKGPISFCWENVSFSYFREEEEGHATEIPVLKNINLRIKAGENLAIVGENGSGKTTFVKLLCGLLGPKEGRITVNGTDAANFEPEDYRNLFSAVFQKSGVLPVSIGDNIALNVHGDEEFDEESVWNCIRLANLEEKVRSLPEGLDTCLGKRIAEHGTELSGGELQRLLLARALYKNAPVLILDEPTAALDPIAEHEIYQAYHKLTEGKTSVFISHRLASTRFCDRILVMEDGEIVEMGTHDELMEQKGKYAEMFELQSRYYTDREVLG